MKSIKLAAAAIATVFALGATAAAYAADDAAATTAKPAATKKHSTKKHSTKKSTKPAAAPADSMAK